VFAAETYSAASSTSTRPQRDNRRSGFRHPQADPDYWKKDKRARRKEKRLPTRWNEDHTMLILDDSDSED